MKTPNVKDLEFKSALLFENDNITVKCEYKFSQHGKTQTNKINLNSTLRPHTDLVVKIEDLKEFVLQSEELDYIKEIIDLNGFKDPKQVEQAVEGCLLEMSNKLKVVGISVSGKDDNLTCVISYRKTLRNEKAQDYKTQPIELCGGVWEFEEDLKEALEKIKKEVFYYMYNGKHFDYEQLETYKDENFNEK